MHGAWPGVGAIEACRGWRAPSVHRGITHNRHQATGQLMCRCQNEETNRRGARAPRLAPRPPACMCAALRLPLPLRAGAALRPPLPPRAGATLRPPPPPPPQLRSARGAAYSTRRMRLS